jgi:hypothetical protein
MQRRLFPASSGIRPPIGIGRNASVTATGTTTPGAVYSSVPVAGEPLPEDEPEEWIQEEQRAILAARSMQEKKPTGDQEKPPVKRPTARRRSTAAERQMQ